MAARGEETEAVAVAATAVAALVATTFAAAAVLRSRVTQGSNGEYFNLSTPTGINKIWFLNVVHVHVPRCVARGRN